MSDEGDTVGDGEALLRAVCERPDDDTPRLVYADWLEENGDPDRAAFIRLQVRVAMLYRAADPEADRVHREARAVWDRCGEAWRAGLPAAGGAVWPPLMFFRGFPERLRVPTDAGLVAAAGELLDRVPVRHLVIDRFTGDPGFAALTALGRLKTLSVTNLEADAGVVREFMRCHRHLSPTVLLAARFGPAGTALHRELVTTFAGRLFHADPPVQAVAPPPRRRGRRR